MPDDRTIDGVDIGGLVGLSDRRPPSDRPIHYILDGTVEAVRVGRWKLHVHKGGRAVTELYDLVDDVGEAHDVAGDHPEVVASLQAQVDLARADLGDESLGIVGAGVRPIGKVDDPVTLTTFDPDHPYTRAEYDLPDRG